MNGTLCTTSQVNESLPGARATARIAPTGARATARIAPTGARATARIAPTIHDLFNVTTETPAPEDIFATTPMKATRLEFDWQREEEAHTSFEAAISNRVMALQRRHISMNERAGARAGGNVESAMGMLVSMAVAIWHNVCFAPVWQRGLLVAGTALMLTLAGFDLMGWLVLHAR